MCRKKRNLTFTFSPLSRIRINPALRHCPLPPGTICGKGRRKRVVIHASGARKTPTRMTRRACTRHWFMHGEEPGHQRPLGHRAWAYAYQRVHAPCMTARGYGTATRTLPSCTTQRLRLRIVPSLMERIWCFHAAGSKRSN
jgi:hypothetical protein